MAQFNMALVSKLMLAELQSASLFQVQPGQAIPVMPSYEGRLSDLVHFIPQACCGYCGRPKTKNIQCEGCGAFS